MFKPQLYGVVPVKEKAWVSPLLLLLPPLLAVLLCLPVPLMQMTHRMIALPGGLVCTSPEIQQFSTYETSVAILGFLLPGSIVVCLVLGLSIRRCISCSGGTCVSSFCKEEMCLALLTLPYLASYLAIYLPIIDHYLDKLDMPITGIQAVITPEIARAMEMLLGLLLPAIMYSVLGGYRQFCSQPDTSDLRRCKREQYLTPDTAMDNNTITHSQSSLDLELVTRSTYS